MTTDRPTIVITVGNSELARKAAFYVTAIEDAGGNPILVPPDGDTSALAGADGLLLSGGADIDPVNYGQSLDPRTEDIEADRDALELAMVAEAQRLDLPILGICRGFQLLNVAYGGGLVQHVDEHVAPEWESSYHHITVTGSSRLAHILEHSGDIAVNSRHHQAVTGDVLAPGLVATAIAPDGLIEGLEDPSRPWVMAVQCHPERASEVDPRFRSLFLAFIEAARDRRGATRK